MFEPGDIICTYRKKYEGPFKYLLMRLILFFTTEWWHGEKTSTVYHTELVYDKIGDLWFSVTMEPPCCRLQKMPLKRVVVFRLKEKPDGFEGEFRSYANVRLGQRYDYIKLLMCLLDWIFHTTWFTDKVRNLNRDICSEFTAGFYKDYGIPCSKLEPDSTKPDDIFDYCIENDNIFEKVYEETKHVNYILSFLRK